MRDIPSHPVYQELLARALGNLGLVLGDLGKSEESEQVLRRSMEIQEKLASEHPQVPEYRSQIGAGLHNMALILKGREKWEEARQLLERAVVHQQAALETIPGNCTYRTFLSFHLLNLTQVQLALGDPVAAARTAEDFAHHVNAPGRPLFPVVCDCETVIADAEATQRPDDDPERRESQLAASVLLFKTVIQEAIQRASDDPDQYHIADLLSTAPEPLRDPDLALGLARRAVELKPEDGLCQQSLGWALYRSGDFRGCIEAIGKQADDGVNGFVLAMAFWQLGEKTKAQTLCEGTNEWLKGYEQRCEEALKQGRVKYPLPVQLKCLQAEAAALCQPRASAAPPWGTGPNTGLALKGQHSREPGISAPFQGFPIHPHCVPRAALRLPWADLRSPLRGWTDSVNHVVGGSPDPPTRPTEGLRGWTDRYSDT